MHDFQGYFSRTSQDQWFQDFSGHGIFKKKCRTFHGALESCLWMVSRGPLCSRTGIGEERITAGEQRTRGGEVGKGRGKSLAADLNFERVNSGTILFYWHIALCTLNPRYKPHDLLNPRYKLHDSLINRYHHRQTATKDHELMTAVKDEMRPNQYISSRCSQHPHESVKLYCNECSTVCCLVCFAEAHKQHDCSHLDKVSVTLWAFCTVCIYFIKVTGTSEYRCYWEESNHDFCKFSWGSAPDPAGGAYSIPPSRPMAVFKGIDREVVRGEMGEGKGKERREEWREGRGQWKVWSLGPAR